MTLPRLFLQLWLVCAFFSIISSASAQTPANDEFSNAIPLAGAPVSTTGNTSNAGLEINEFNPAYYGGNSVWYSWTAPSSGWFTIHTSTLNPANSLDTVLVLYANAANLESAPVLGHNDESGRFTTDFPAQIYPFGRGPSRLIFKANAGTQYKIAVHGYIYAQGPFDLFIAAEPTPDIYVDSVSFTPATIDIGTSEESSLAEVAIKSTFPFSNAYIGLYRPTVTYGYSISDDYIDPSDLIEGTSTDGTYSASLSVMQYEKPAHYPVIVNVNSPALDLDIQFSSTGKDDIEDDYLIPANGSTLNVENSGIIDEDPPVITSFSGIPESHDFSNGDLNFNIDLEITDDITGFTSGDIYLSDDVSSHYIGSIDGSSPVTGDSNSGTYSVDINVSPVYSEIPPGTYETVIYVYDLVNNFAVYSPIDTPLPGDTNSTITISASVPINDILEFREILGNSLPASSSGTTNLTSLETGESTLDGAIANSVWYEWTAPSSSWVSLNATGTTGSFKPILALYTGNNFTDLQELGRNNKTIFSGTDHNSLQFFAIGGTSYKIAVCGRFGTSINNNGTFDLSITSAPAPTHRVTSVSIAPSMVDVATGEQDVTIDIALQCDSNFDSGGYMTVYLSPTSNSYFQGGVFLSSFHRLAGGDGFNGTYRATYTVPGYIDPGDWHITIESSLAGAYYRWTAQGNNPIPDTLLIPQFGANLDVTNSGDVDVSPPQLVSVTGLPPNADVTSPVSVTLNIQATDDVSGIRNGDLFLVKSSDGSSTSTGIGTFNSSHFVPGSTTNNATFEYTLNLTSFIEPGTYQLEIYLYDNTDKRTIYGPYDNAFPSGSSITVTIGTTAPGYAGWVETQDFGASGLEDLLDDANFDGTNNLMCYAFNLPPMQQASTLLADTNDDDGLPLAKFVGSGPTFRLRIEYLRRRGSSTGLSYTPQFGSSLTPSGEGAWQTGSHIFLGNVNTDWERVASEDPVQGDPSRFGRILVEYSAP